MPELPQIEPEQGLKVPETVGIQRLNLERPNPALEELKQQGHSVEFQASYLGAALQRQKMATDLLNSESQTVTGFYKLKQSLEGVQDPDAKLKLLDTGSQSVVDGILKANPAIAPHVADQLNLRRTEFMRDSLTESITAKHAIGAANYKVSLDNMAIAAGNSDLSHQDELILKEQGLQRIQQAAANGDISPAQAIADGYNFTYNVQKNKLYGLLSRPDGINQVLGMSQKDSGLTGQDWLAFHNKAIEQANHTYDIESNTSRINRLQYLQDFDSGKTTQAQDIEAVHFARITPAQFEGKWGHPPDNIGGRMDAIKRLRTFTDPRQAEDFMANNVDGNPAYSSDDKAILHANATDIINDLRSESGQRKADAVKQYSDNITSSYPQLFIQRGAGMGDPYTLQRKQIAAVTANVKAQIRQAKTPEAEAAALVKANSEVEKIMEPKYSKGRTPSNLPRAEVGVE